MKIKFKALLPLLFAVALLAVIPFAVNSEECTHRNIMHWSEIEPACHYSGNYEYFECLDCGYIWTDQTHFGFFDPYIPPLGGEVEHVEAKEPSCHEMGNIEYWHCAECDQYWADEELTIITNIKSVIMGYGPRENVQHVEAVAPSCYEEGNVEYWYCPECEEIWLDEACTQPANRFDVIIPAEHPLVTHVEAVDPECHKEGNIEYWYCTICECYWLDEALTMPISYRSTVIPFLGGDMEYIPAIEPTCTEPGNIEYWCCYDCGYIELPPGWYIGNPPLIPALRHLWGEWSVVSEPTRFADGEKCRTCKRDYCGEIEYEVIPRLNFTISADNYNIVMTEAQIIDHIRYAPGVYNTSAELRASPDLKNFNAAVIAQNTVDGVFSKELKNAGLYTFWVRFTDGSVIMQQVDMTNMTQSVSSKYLELTVHDLFGVKEYHIAKGSYASYDELKDNYDIKVTAAEIAGAKDHTVLLGDSGYYTVCVKYDDPEREDLILNHHVSAIMPGFESNGLNLNISNLTMAKVIRVAPGEWKTAREVKIADGSRSFNQKWIQGAVSYDLTFKEAGVYTVAVEYNYGLTVVRTVTIEQSEPTFVQDGNKVTFGNLDGLYVIRYAPGEYTYAGDIKRAEGARFLRPTAIDENGEISIEVGEGIYTFCVQYHDGSYNYYTVDNTKSLLERYGLSVKCNLWYDRMPSSEPDENLYMAVSFRSDGSTEVPEFSFSVMVEGIEIDFSPTYDNMNYRASDSDCYLLGALFPNGEKVCVEITVTINGESETIVYNTSAGSVY